MTGSIEVIGRMAIPGSGNFDHAAVHLGSGRVFVAHTGADTVDVLDPDAMAVLATIEGCPGASGVVCDSEHELVAAASRSGGFVLLIDAATLEVRSRISVGPAPNGVAFDTSRQSLLVADVEARQAILVDTVKSAVVATRPLPGRPRWAVHDPQTGRFHLNIASPAEVLSLDSESLAPLGAWSVAADGPHGLDLDPPRRIAFVACDSGTLVALDSDHGHELKRLPLPGTPDVTFFNPVTLECYVGVGDPGVLVVADTREWRVSDVFETEPGAHTFAFDSRRQRLHVLLPASQEALVLACTGGGQRSTDQSRARW